MKNFKILILLNLFIFLTSCSSDSDNNSTVDTSQIVGVWFLESATIDGEEVGSSDEIEFTSNQRAFFTYYNLFVFKIAVIKFIRIILLGMN